MIVGAFAPLVAGEELHMLLLLLLLIHTFSVLSLQLKKLR